MSPSAGLLTKGTLRCTAGLRVPSQTVFARSRWSANAENATSHEVQRLRPTRSENPDVTHGGSSGSGRVRPSAAPMIWALVVLVLATLMLVLRGWLVMPSDERVAPGTAPTIMLQDDDLRRLRDSHEELMRIAMSHVGSIADPVAQPEDPAGATVSRGLGVGWPGGYRRNNVDLATQFMNAPDQVRVGNLVRHTMLNREDRPIYESQREELQAIVDKYGNVLALLFRNYREAQTREMISIIEAWSVSPASFARPSTEEIRRFANAVASTLEEAESYYREFLRSPPVAAMKGLSHIDHNGDVYLYSQFPSLPVSDRLHADVQFLAIEYLATVCAWFESRRLTSSASVSSILSAASNFSQSARRVGDTGRKPRIR